MPPEGNEETEETSEETSGTPEPFAWKGHLSDDIRSAEILGRFGDDGSGLASLVRELSGAQKLLGKDKLPMPKDEEDKETWSEVWKRLGRPEKPEEYDLKDLERPEGLWDPDFESRMVQKMHELGMNQRQVRELMATYIEDAKSQLQDVAGAVEANRAESVKALRKEFGSAYDGRLAVAREAAKQVFGGSLEKVSQMVLADGTALMDHPDMVRAFAKLGQQLQEAEILGDKSQPIATGLSPQEAQKRLNQLMADEKFVDAWLDPQSPGHAAALAQRSELMAALHPEATE